MELILRCMISDSDTMQFDIMYVAGMLLQVARSAAHSNLPWCEIWVISCQRTL